MTTLTTGIQTVNIGGLVLMLVMCVYLYVRWHDVRGLVIPPGLWAAYGVVFYTFVLTGRLVGTEQLLWGAIHRMLGIYMVLGGLVTMWAILAAPETTPDDEADDEADDDTDE